MRVDAMKTKKVYKLKLWAKVLLVVLVLVCIASYYGYQYYQDYLYKQTYEYKLLELGYTKDDIKIKESVLSDKQIDNILTYEFNEFIPKFLECKYFKFEKLDLYLSQVITQEDDFFKYHGTDGYDYDYIVSVVNVGALNSHYTNTVMTDRDKDIAMLVNKYTELGVDYKPDDLVSIPWKYRLGLESDIKLIRQEVYDAYLEMWNAAKEAGHYLLVDSGFRSSESQEQVYKSYENRYGTKFADSVAARAGFSEHQTGLALDIYSKECASATTFKDSKTYAWLIENSYKFGFILRYPDTMSEITGYNYESWHYRYVGVELAKKVYESGLTYDEYYVYYFD